MIRGLVGIQASLLIIRKHGGRKIWTCRLGCEFNAVVVVDPPARHVRASSEWTLCAYVYSRLSAPLPNELPLIGF